MQRITALWNRGLVGKAIISLIGLVIACCVIGILVPHQPRQQGAAAASETATVDPSTATPRVAVAPAATDIPLASTTPTPSDTPAPTNTPEPTATPEAPTMAPQPTEAAVAPVVQPEPTVAPAAQPAASGPTYHGSGSNQTVDPPWWPCEKGQIKGNRNSDIYHVPTGRSYAKTFKNVQCFDTAAEAEGAGYRAAKN